MATKRRVVTSAAPAAPGGPTLDPVLQAAREAVAEEIVRRQRLPRAIASLEASLFPKQRAFVESKAKRVVANSGRRSGKTFGLGARILRVAERYPNTTIPVFERTQTCEAARVLWKTLQELDAKFNLGATFHHSRFIMRLANGAEVVLMSADTLEACDKARGGRYPAAFVDEAGTLRSHVLEYLVTDVLEAALLDYQGSLTITGTPTPRRQGTFFELCNNAEWDRHCWDFRDNPTIPLEVPPAQRAAANLEYFAAYLARHGFTEQSPRVQREWFGQWVDDNTSLVYRLGGHNYRPDSVGEPPDFRAPGWYFTVGMDVGWNDPCAFVVVAWRRDQPEMWVVESFEYPELLPDQVAAHLERLRLRYPSCGIVMDAGGHGGKIIEQSLAQRYGIRAVAAKKRGKFDHIAFLNSDLASGRLKLLLTTNRELIADLLTLRYAPPSADGLVPDEEHPGDDNHLPDAMLYACTYITGVRRGFGEAAAPERGSAAWARAYEERLLEADAKRHSPGPQERSTSEAAEAMLGWN
jgi:hypothetical protein